MNETWAKHKKSKLPPPDFGQLREQMAAEARERLASNPAATPPPAKESAIKVWLGVAGWVAGIIGAIASVAWVCWYLKENVRGLDVGGAAGDAGMFCLGIIELLVILTVVLFFYFLPSLVAANRKHRNCQAIFTMNLLFGWTFIGWGISMVWAMKSE